MDDDEVELARKFGEPSTRHPIVDVDLVVVVVVDLDGDGGVDLVGGAVDRRVESGRNRGRSLPITRRMLSFQRLDVYQRAIQGRALGDAPSRICAALTPPG